MPKPSTMRDKEGKFIKGHGRSCKPFVNVIPIGLKKEIRIYKARIIRDLGGGGWWGLRRGGPRGMGPTPVLTP